MASASRLPPARPPQSQCLTLERACPLPDLQGAQGGLGEDPPLWPGLGGSGVTEKIRHSHPFSQTHPFPALSQTKTHTHKAPAITLGPHTMGPLTCEHPQISSREGLHLRTQPGHGGGEAGGEYKYSHDPGSNCSRLSDVRAAFWGWCVLGGNSTLFPPLRGARCSATTTPAGGRGAGQRTPRLG